VPETFVIDRQGRIAYKKKTCRRPTSKLQPFP